MFILLGVYAYRWIWVCHSYTLLHLYREPFGYCFLSSHGLSVSFILRGQLTTGIAPRLSTEGVLGVGVQAISPSSAPPSIQ